jgi:hypothetical protein
MSSKQKKDKWFDRTQRPADVFISDCRRGYEHTYPLIVVAEGVPNTLIGAWDVDDGLFVLEQPSLKAIAWTYFPKVPDRFKTKKKVGIG